MIPIDQISILNSRTRNNRQHQEIVENIGTIGLKRPITVSRHPNSTRYDLVCGEGRLEAFRLLGESEIPAIIIDASEADCLVMSLVENIARRQHRPIEIMREIGTLHERAYSAFEISQKIGVSENWVSMVITLLERGEERLLVAVETGLIPVRFAVDIARADHAEVQEVLTEAYSSGKLKGKKLAAIRRLLDQRMKRSKTTKSNSITQKSQSRKITAAELMRVYQKESDKQRILVKKSDYTQTKILFIVEALRDLLTNDNFATLLRAEGLNAMPRALEARISGDKLQ